MKKFFFSALLVMSAAAAPAQTSFTLEIRDGLVNLDATSVPTQQILTEWGRVGGTRVVGAEKISGAPLTLKLENVPEGQALDIILRNVAGYMAAPRRAAAEPGASSYDRIVILPTTSTPAAAVASAGGRTGVGVERRVPPRPPGMPDPDSEPTMQPEPEDANAFQQPPVFTFPQPQAPGNANSVFVPVQQGGFGVPMPQDGQQPIMLQPNPNGQPTIYNFMPQGSPQPNSGFSVIGAPTPGMVQQPAPPPGQAPPGQRPPGN